MPLRTSISPSRYPATGLSLLFLFPFVWLGAAPVFAAGGSIFVVDDGATVKEITEAELTSSIPGASGQVLAHTPAGRGSLVDLGDVKLYQPSSEFFEKGSDSFHFEAALVGGGSVWSTAFIALDLRGDGSFTLPLDDPGELAAVSLVNEGSIHVNDIQPIRGAYDLAFELQSGREASVTFSLPPDGRGNGPAGGALGGGIDPGDPYWASADAELVIATAGDASNQELARVVLLRGEVGALIAGEVRTETGFTRTVAVPVESGASWELQWWGATAAGSRDGGAVLILGGSLAARLTGLDNPQRSRPATWSFGGLRNSGFDGQLRLDDLRGEAALSVPSLAPIFADHFAAPAAVWSGGECGESGLPAVSGGELRIGLDPTVDCFKSRRFDQAQRQVRARLSLDLTAAVIGAVGWVSVLRGVRGEATGLELRVRRSFAGELGVEVISSQAGDVTSNLGWSQIPESGPLMIEVHWWAASSPLAADGGLRLHVDGDLVAEWLGLAEPAQGLDELRLGALDASWGSSGEIAFDVIEAWR